MTAAWSCALLAWLLFSPERLAAQEGGDLQAQILYAYQTEDMGRLQSIRNALQAEARGESPTAAVRYHLAHADYRIALLAREKQRALAAEAFHECAAQLSQLADVDTPSAEVLALQSICYLELARARKLQAAFLRARAVDVLARAASLDARNPRVRLVQALHKLRSNRDSSSVPPELLQAAELFEHSSATRDESPGWGHAECYLLLGRALRIRGEALGARNWIEKALIAAPDYRAAQAELAQLNR